MINEMLENRDAMGKAQRVHDEVLIQCIVTAKVVEVERLWVTGFSFGRVGSSLIVSPGVLELTSETTRKV